MDAASADPAAATRELSALLEQDRPDPAHVRACLVAGADPWAPADRGMSAVEKLLGRWQKPDEGWSLLQICLEYPPARRRPSTDPLVGKVLRQGFQALNPAAMQTWQRLLSQHVDDPAALPARETLDQATERAICACQGVGKMKPASAQGLRAVLVHQAIDASWLARWASRMRNWNVLAVVLETASNPQLLCQQGWQSGGWAWAFLKHTYAQDAKSLVAQTFQPLPPTQRNAQTPALLVQLAAGPALSSLPLALKKAARWVEGCPNARVQQATGRSLFAWLVQSTENADLLERYAGMTTGPAKFLQMQGKVLAELVRPAAGIQDCTGAWEAWTTLALSEQQRAGQLSELALLAAATTLLDRGVLPPPDWEMLPFWTADSLPPAWRRLPDRARALRLEQTTPAASSAPRPRL